MPMVWRGRSARKARTSAACLLRSGSTIGNPSHAGTGGLMYTASIIALLKLLLHRRRVVAGDQDRLCPEAGVAGHAPVARRDAAARAGQGVGGVVRIQSFFRTASC